MGEQNILSHLVALSICLPLYAHQPVLDAMNAAADQVAAKTIALQECSRAFLNPPHVFLRDYIEVSIN